MYSKVFELNQELFRALANSRRLEVIQLLRDQEMSVSEMQKMLDLPQANLSQHLQVLREARVVEVNRRGKEMLYRVGDQKLVKACDLIREVLIDQHKDDDNMDELTMKMKDLIPVVKDPVCGMRVSPKTAGYACKHKGRHYYFCASGCLREFEKNPHKYEDRHETK